MVGTYGRSEGDGEGKYRAIVELGQGGTANVYLAVARGPSGFNKLVVLKALRSNLASDPEFPRMFLNEARLAARLNHPNIVQTYEVFEEQGLPVIVMEYLEGQPLSNVVARADRTKSLPLAMHLRVISEALGGLHYSHELTDFDGTKLNVVHRDVTPHNVFVTFDGQVKVLDFGIAKLNGSMVETATGVIKGKIRYMPAEQLAGEEVDRRVDVFAAGVMMWEAATGQKLWKGMSETAIMNALLRGEIPSLREIRPDVHPELERICLKALAYDREERYPSAAEFQAAIEGLLAQLPPVTNREIGKFVSTLFEDVRAETRKVIERQLSHAASLSSSPDLDSESPLPSATPHLRGGYTASSVLEDETGRPARFRSHGVLVSVAAVAAAALLAIVAWKQVKPASAPPPEPAPFVSHLEPVLAARPAPMERAMLRVFVFPRDAQIYLDDVRLPGNPVLKAVLRDGATHKVRVEAAGHLPEAVNVVFDQDVDLNLTLKRAPYKAANSPKARASTGPSDGPRAQDPTPNCSPPYYLDSHGIKKFKPECM